MIDENGEHDNEDVYLLWGVLICLFFWVTAAVAFGWVAVLLLTGLAGAGWISVIAYLGSEERRYRQAQRELRQHDEWMRRQLRRYK